MFRSRNLLAFAFALALSLLFLGTTTVSSSPLPTRVERRQAAASLALASSALSIYNNDGTTPFTQPTAVGAACPVGYQSYVDADSGLTQCCAGSIVNSRCFQDGGTLVYTADPESVIEAGGVGAAGAATSTAVVAVTTSTGAAAVSALTSGGGSVVTAASSKPTTGTYTITSYVPVATGGTQAGLAASSTSYSRLSQTLTPTGGSGGPSVYKPNGAATMNHAAWLPVAVAVCVAFVAGGGAALW